VKDVAEVCYQMAYFAVKYEIYGDHGGPLNIMQKI